MAKRKTKAAMKRTTGKAAKRKRARKVSSSAKGKRKKRTLGRVKRKRMKGAQKVQATKLPNAPAVETVVVDVIEEPLPGVITVTEFEETEIRDVNREEE
jgi:hypothetical protein